MKNRKFEAALGAFVLLITTFVAIAGYRSIMSQNTLDHYALRAVFSDVGGIDNGSDVRLNGIKIGIVQSRSLDPKTYQAVVVMAIDAGVRIPSDSKAAISSEGVTGGKYIAIEPGHSKVMLTQDTPFESTTPYRSIETQISRIIFLATSAAE